MSSVNPVSVLIDFTSQINLSGHQYVKKDEEGKFTLQKTKANNYQDLIDLIGEANKVVGKEKEVSRAVTIIRSHLEQKISGLFSIFISKADKAAIHAMIGQLPDVEEADDQPASEGEARMEFYKELPQMLHVRSAAVNDLKTIKVLSKRVWRAFENYDDYKKHMKLLFEGEHILFEEEDAEDESFSLYDKLKDNQKTGAYLRGSSHYDHGTTNGKTGGPVPQEATEVDNPQYEIEGPQVKALLFGRVKLAKGADDKLAFGKTFDEVVRGKNDDSVELKPKKYTFLQTEWAPDSSSFLSANFWKHRVLSFVLYAARKTLGLEKPNVGPYGYGHGDANQPTVIPLKKD